MQGDRQVGVGDDLTRPAETAGRIAGLGSGEVEADDAEVPAGHGQLGDRLGVVHGAHGDDEKARHTTGCCFARPDPGCHCFHHLGRFEAPGGMKAGRKPDLGVAHTIGGEVLDRFAGHPLERCGSLEHRSGVGEGGEVGLERSRAALMEPRRELRGTFCRKRVTALGCELDHGLGPQAAIEVIVEERFWKLRDSHALLV